MSSRLEQILAATRRRVDALDTSTVRALEQRAAARPPTRSLTEALRRPGKGSAAAEPLRVMGEIKRRSPSAGAIYEDLDPAVTARALARAGCRALSVLTEPDFFGGSLSTLETARSSVDLPLLRKDFVVDPRQVVEARAHGADAVLLLAAALDDATFARCRDEARAWGLSVLAEAHGRAEADRLLEMEVEILGINARDLTTFEVDLPAALRLCATVPEDVVVVAESGVRDRESAQRVVDAPVDAALVGEGLMRGGDPAARFHEFFGPGGESP